MKKIIGAVIGAVFLTACARWNSTDVSRPVLPPAVPSPALAIIEQIPAELTIEHFAQMTLVGTGLTLREVERNSAYVHYNADYVSNGLTVSGIMKIPLGDGPFPLLLTNHGYIAPSVYTRGRGLKREEDYLARQGFAVFHSDYRGHADSDESPDTERRIYDAGLEYAMDVLNAVNAIRAADVAKVDTSRIGMLGHSMGGGIALNIAVAYPEFVDAFVLYAPVNGDAWENFNRWRREREEDDRTAEVFGERTDNPALWDALSSETYFDQIQAPILLFQGTKDKDVPFAWSDELAADLRALGKDITYVVYDGEGHEFASHWSDFMEKTAAFFKRVLASE